MSTLYTVVSLYHCIKHRPDSAPDTKSLLLIASSLQHTHNLVYLVNHSLCPSPKVFFFKA
jgi:hypothetical protein